MTIYTVTYTDGKTESVIGWRVRYNSSMGTVFIENESGTILCLANLSFLRSITQDTNPRPSVEGGKEGKGEKV